MTKPATAPTLSLSDVAAVVDEAVDLSEEEVVGEVLTRLDVDATEAGLKYPTYR